MQLKYSLGVTHVVGVLFIQQEGSVQFPRCGQFKYEWDFILRYFQGSISLLT